MKKSDQIRNWQRRLKTPYVGFSVALFIALLYVSFALLPPRTTASPPSLTLYRSQTGFQTLSLTAGSDPNSGEPLVPTQIYWRRPEWRARRWLIISPVFASRPFNLFLIDRPDSGISWIAPSTLTQSEIDALEVFVFDEFGIAADKPPEIQAKMRSALRNGSFAESRPYWFGIALNVGGVVLASHMIAAVVTAVMLQGARLREDARTSRGLCPACAYDRSGITALAACPECGHEPQLAEAGEEQQPLTHTPD